MISSEHLPPQHYREQRQEDPWDLLAARLAEKYELLDGGKPCLKELSRKVVEEDILHLASHVCRGVHSTCTCMHVPHTHTHTVQVIQKKNQVEEHSVATLP